MVSLDRDLETIRGGVDWGAAHDQGVEWGKTAGIWGLEGGGLAAGLWGARHLNLVKGLSRGIQGAAWGTFAFPVGYAVGASASVIGQALSGSK